MNRLRNGLAKNSPAATEPTSSTITMKTTTALRWVSTAGSAANATGGMSAAHRARNANTRTGANDCRRCLPYRIESAGVRDVVMSSVCSAIATLSGAPFGWAGTPFVPDRT
jgi:hypothetical protein